MQKISDPAASRPQLISLEQPFDVTPMAVDEDKYFLPQAHVLGTSLSLPSANLLPSVSTPYELDVLEHLWRVGGTMVHAIRRLIFNQTMPLNFLPETLAVPFSSLPPFLPSLLPPPPNLPPTSANLCVSIKCLPSLFMLMKSQSEPCVTFSFA